MFHAAVCKTLHRTSDIPSGAINAAFFIRNRSLKFFLEARA